MVSTLLEGGFDLAELAPFHMSKAANFLEASMTIGKGVVGFGRVTIQAVVLHRLTIDKAPNLGADADDSSKTLLILNLLRRHASPEMLLKHFESESYFKTYPLERDPSFSANCNVLIALIHVQDPSKYAPQIEKIMRFLVSSYGTSGLKIRDKWVRDIATTSLQSVE